MIHRSFLLLCTLLACTLCRCQLNVYKTYQDYVDHNARSYPDVEFKKWKGDEHTVLVFERKGKDDLEVACDGIWGFGYKEVLFRVSTHSAKGLTELDFELAQQAEEFARGSEQA